jgi:hypothetical protein
MAFSFKRLLSNVLPVGTYKVQITSINFKTSATGVATNDMVVHYTVVDGSYAKRTLNETISEKAFSFKLKPFLKAVGADMDREFATAAELYAYGIKASTGKIIMVDVGVRTYNGTEYNQINDYKPLPGSVTSSEEVLAEFETSPALQPEKPTLADVPVLGTTAEVPTIGVEDDDLPF